MKEATLEEVLKIANTLKYVSCIDVKGMIAGVKTFFGDSAAKVSFCFTDEYNDQDYDLRLSDLTVYDDTGKELSFSEEKEDAFYDWQYSMNPDMPGSSEGDQCSGVYEIDIKTETLISPKIPKIYLES